MNANEQKNQKPEEPENPNAEEPKKSSEKAEKSEEQMSLGYEVPRTSFLIKVLSIVFVMFALLAAAASFPLFFSETHNVRLFFCNFYWIGIILASVFGLILVMMMLVPQVKMVSPENVFGLIALIFTAAGSLLFLSSWKNFYGTALAVSSTAILTGFIMVLAKFSSIDFQRKRFIWVCIAFGMFLYGIGVAMVICVVGVPEKNLREFFGYELVVSFYFVFLFSVFLANNAQLVIGGRKYHLSLGRR
ncbi:hypothetical protein L596_025851 [Steinernema carpocapsae]|uniref:Uncharacterized protein n=1 Tax=Steinernema carpocapsae TaxID=34508 RepID=A0A4U5M901_STECR|nr:hypothetical protein L596_025851 [Steinernema carpocapsae]